jgi:hypothetical protein
MAEDIKSSFGGFDALVGDLLRDTNSPSNNMTDPDEMKRQMESLGETKDVDSEPAGKGKLKEPTGGFRDERTDKSKTPQLKNVDPDSFKKEVLDDEEEIEDEVDESDKDASDKSKKEDKKKKEVSEESDSTLKDKGKEGNDNEIDVEETELVGAFSELFAEELGWKFEEGEKPSSIKDLVKYMQDVITANSEPDFASDEIKELDEFVREGGSVKDFYSKVYKSEINIDSVDLTKVDSQKAVIRENLRNRGYSEQRIDKLISRYEEQDALEEEATDSLEEVKESREKTKQQLLANQKIAQQEVADSQLMFVQNVQKIIKDTESIRGISIPDKEKKALVEYIFKPGKDGMTNYQRDYNSNLKNLVESAYFTMKGDTLVNNIQKRAASDAVKNLKTKLKAKDNSIKNTGSDMDDSRGSISHLWDIAGAELQSFK